MIAPMVERAAPETSARQHAMAIRVEEQRPMHRLKVLAQQQPAAVIALGMVVGLSIGWLVKRKKWSH